MRYEKVKPCPFCGCPSVTVKAISGYYRAKCNGCESRTGYGGSEKEALERWNKRTTGNNNGGVLKRKVALLLTGQGTQKQS